MPLHAAIRLVTHLNVLGPGTQDRPTQPQDRPDQASRPPGHSPSVDVAARTIQGRDAAHHVADPDGLLGLVEVAASPLHDGLAAALADYRARPDASADAPGGWLLALPRPGRLGPLRGPQSLTRAALQAGAAVIPTWGGVAWVPWRVGPAIQWETFRAERPMPLVSSAEAEQLLSHAIIAATSVLGELGMTSGRRPEGWLPEMAAGYPARQRRAAERALLLVEATDAALADDSEILHTHAIATRAASLRQVQQAALDSLQSACAWHPTS